MTGENDVRTVAAARRLWSLNSKDSDPKYEALPKPYRTDLCWKAAQILAAADAAVSVDEHADEAIAVVGRRSVVPGGNAGELASRVNDPAKRAAHLRPVNLTDIPQPAWAQGDTDD